MKPQTLGSQYDRIAQWWHDQHVNSNYGVTQLERALTFARPEGTALDVGCGAGDGCDALPDCSVRAE